MALPSPAARSDDRAVTRRSARTWPTRTVWALAACMTLWLIAFSGTDPGSVILFVLAVGAVAPALLCVGRAIAARGVHRKLLWLGRALALVGAAVVVSFPAVLYQEIAMLVGQGRALTYDIQRALWYEAAVMPLVLVPALVTLRWPRLGGVLFVLDGLLNILQSLYQPFGVLYPEATAGGWTGVPLLSLILQPAFIAAALLLFGSAGTATAPVHARRRLSARPAAPSTP
jgi:hypothetical protein